MIELKKLIESTLPNDFEIIKEENPGNKLVLNEGIEEVKKYFPNISDKDFNKLIKQDPTYQGGNELGKYGKWILSLYNNFLKDKIAYQKWEKQKEMGNNYPEPIKKSQEKLEDFEKIHNLLKQYDIINKKLKTNINNIKSVNELYATVNNAKKQGISDDNKINHLIDLVKKSVSKGGEIVFKDDEWIVLIPKTLESSVVFGDDTNWCTTAPSGKYYNGYLKEYGGNYYINVNLKTGELYQFHFESQQFMDKNDKDISINFSDIIKKDSKIWNFYSNLMKSIKRNTTYIKFYFTKNPSEEQQWESLKKDPFIINLIENPSEEMIMYAFKKNPFVIRFIKNPSEELQWKAIKKDPFTIEYIKNPSEEMIIYALKKDPFTIEYIKNPSEKLQLEAIKINPFTIRYIKNPSEKLQLEAIQLNPYTIGDIKNPSEELQWKAIKKDPFTIRYIKNPSEKLQLEAIQLNPYTIEDIKNPSEKVKKIAKKLQNKLNKIDESVLNEEAEEKFLAYHGSQHKNFNFDKNRVLYLTTSKEKAISYAKREWDEGLIEGEIPVVYTFEVSIKNPYRTKGTEEEFFDFCDSVMNEYGKEDLIEKGYDSIMHNDLIGVFYPNQVQFKELQILPKSHEYYYTNEDGIDPNDIDAYYYDEDEEPGKFDKYFNESIDENYKILKNPDEKILKTYLQVQNLRFAFNPMSDELIVCDELHNPINLNESKEKYITGILSPNLVEVHTDDSKEIIEHLLGRRLKKIFGNHYEIITY